MDRSTALRYLERSLLIRNSNKYLNITTDDENDTTNTKKISGIYNITSSKEDRPKLKEIVESFDVLVDILRTQDLHIAVSFLEGFNLFPFIKGRHDVSKECFLNIMSKFLNYIYTQTIYGIEVLCKGTNAIEQEYNAIEQEYRKYNEIFADEKNILFNLVYIHGYFLFNKLGNMEIFRRSEFGYVLILGVHAKIEYSLNEDLNRMSEVLLEYIDMLSRLSFKDIFNCMFYDMDIRNSRSKPEINRTLSMIKYCINRISGMEDEKNIVLTSSEKEELNTYVDNFLKNNNESKNLENINTISTPCKTDEHVIEEKEPSQKEIKEVQDIVWNKYCPGDERFGNCFVCGDPIDRKRRGLKEFGHVIAKCKKGPYTVENIRPICVQCNSGKPEDGRIAGMHKMHMYEYIVRNKIEHGLAKLLPEEKHLYVYDEHERRKVFRECDIKLGELLKNKKIDQDRRDSWYKILCENKDPKDKTFQSVISIIQSL